MTIPNRYKLESQIKILKKNINDGKYKNYFAITNKLLSLEKKLRELNTLEFLAK